MDQANNTQTQHWILTLQKKNPDIFKCLLIDERDITHEVYLPHTEPEYDPASRSISLQDIQGTEEHIQGQQVQPVKSDREMNERQWETVIE